MKKKLISLLLVFAMCLSLGTVALADSEDETLLLPTSVTDEIFAVYSSEVELVESIYNESITELTPYTYKMLQTEATRFINNENYKFSEFMTELAVKHFEASQSMARYMPGNATITVIQPYGPLKGDYGGMVSEESSVTETFNMDIQISRDFKGFTLSAGVSGEVSVTVNGPNPYETLTDGTDATHRLAFAVMSGTIIDYEYDLIDSWTGNPVGRFSETRIVDVATAPFTTLMNYNGSFFKVQKLNSNTFYAGYGLTNLEDAIEEHPEYFVD